MKIIPAILCEKLEDCQKMLRQAESFTDYVQIDLMDGVFVPSRSFPTHQINRLETSLSFEVHLMVQNPLEEMSGVSHPRLKKVIVHFESRGNPLDLIREMKGRQMETGLAVNPGTSLSDFRSVSQAVDSLLFLTVEPGYYGSPFKKEVLKKIEETNRLFPGKPISVDGGVSLDNLEWFVEMGVDAVCVGSRIFAGGSPRDNYLRFVSRAEELGTKG